MAYVTVGFFEPDQVSNTPSWLNGLISWWTKSPNSKGHAFSHVELIFSNGFVTSITQQQGVVHYLDGRLLSSPNYCAFYRINLSPLEERRMQKMAQRCASQKIGFNMRGMLCNFMPGVRCMFGSRGKGTVFCSQYITELFQEAGYFMQLDPAFTTPNDLYEAIRDPTECNAIVTVNTALRNARGPPTLDINGFVAKRNPANDRFGFI